MYIFTIIVDEVLDGMAFIESKALAEIALSVQTTGLVNYLKSNPDFSEKNLSITGQSLGGGMALVTVRVLTTKNSSAYMLQLHAISNLMPYKMFLSMFILT